MSDSVLSRYRLVEPQAPASEPVTVDEPGNVRSLFEAHYASVWRLLRRFGVPPAQLDDAAQEVFWVAARRFGDIRTGSEKAFLYGVALRVASNEVKRAQASADLLRPLADVEQRLAQVVPNPEESLEQRRALLLLEAVLDELPLELRSVLVLFELEGLEVARISEIEGIPLGTASSRLRRARQEFSAIAKRTRAMLARGGG